MVVSLHAQCSQWVWGVAATEGKSKGLMQKWMPQSLISCKSQREILPRPLIPMEAPLSLNCDQNRKLSNKKRMVPFGLIFHASQVAKQMTRATPVPLMLLDVGATACKCLRLPPRVPTPTPAPPSPFLLCSPLTLPYAQDLVFPINHCQLLLY